MTPTSTPTRHALVILNDSSGDGSADVARATIDGRLGAAGITAQVVVLAEGVDLAREVNTAVRRGTTLVIAGGGDGTVNAVVNAARPYDLILGVLPLGTLNHFARDLAIPLVLEEALDVIVAGHTVQVDVAEVNGRLFLNNSSVGLYPRIVRLRERYRGRRLTKWVVAAWATWRVTRQGRALRVKLEAEGVAVERATPLVFVGNNPYRMEGLDAGARESLQGGVLGLYVVKSATQWDLLRLVWRIVARTAQHSGELAMLETVAADIDLAGSGAPDRLGVATDGEVVTMELPLAYRCLPRALTVCVPR